MSPEYSYVVYETDDRLAYITLNRPEKLNALGNELRGEMFDALKEAEADRSVGVIVIRGAGRAFSAGYDLNPSSPEGSPYVSPRSNMPDTGTTHPAHYDWSRHAVMANFLIWELAKLVVAQIHGYCLAGGTELASICDFRIVAEDTQIGYPPVRAMGAPWLMPPAKAREFAYTGRFVHRPRDGRPWMGELRTSVRSARQIHRDFCPSHGAHRQRHVDVQQARGEPVVRDDGDPQRTDLRHRCRSHEQAPPRGFRMEHSAP